MIIGFVGTPGSGKTYDAVKKILDNLKLGRKVVTNIDGLDNEKCREYIKTYAGLDDYQLGSRLIHVSNEKMQHISTFAENGSMIVIDEVHRLFSNRDWQTEKNKVFVEWASVHRHQGIDIVLVTQDLEKIDKHARSLIEWSYFYRKVNFFGSLVSNKYLRYTYSGDDHNSKPLAKNMLPYDHKVFRCYKSYVSSDIKEIGVTKGVNVLRHPIFYAIPVVLVGVLWMGSKSSLVTGDIFGAKKATASLPAAHNTLPKNPFVAAPPAPVPAPAPAVSVKPDLPTEKPCSSYKTVTPDGVINLTSSVPPSGKVLKCFGGI